MPTPSHSPHLPARREADVIWQLLFAARPANCGPFVVRPEPGGESAGCVRLQWLVLRAVFCLLSIFACHAHCPSHHLAPFILLAPVHFASFCLPPVPSMCARITISQGRRFVFSQGQQFASYKTVPLAAATRACSGGPCTGPFADLPFFFLQSP